MIDLRLWRIALLVVPVAITVAMFSLQEVPSPREPAITPDAYDENAAFNLTRELSSSAAEPRPGSSENDQLAELVRGRFAAFGGAQGAEQRFEAGGEELRNLIAILPGRSERQVALIASRDVEEGSGAATSIASTAILLEIAGAFSGTTHEKTLVFVSTDGASLGAAGIRRFIADYSDADKLDAAIVVSQPAAREPTAPLVIPWSSGPQSTGIELAETANAILSEEAGQPAGNEPPLRELFRLALPAGLGEQGPLIESGLDAIRISSSGELPPAPSEDEIDEVAAGSVDRFGRAALALMLALDRPGELERGPAVYIGLAGNLLPGWALALIALALLAPVAAAGAAGISRAARSPLEAARSVAWVAVRAVPFLAALLAVYAFGWIGVIPSPPFPFDPGLEGLGTWGKIGVLAVLGVLAGGFYLLRPLHPPPRRAAGAAAPAAISLAALCGLGVWLLNPYLALLLALGLNLWILAAAPIVPGRPATIAAIALGLLPLAAAVWSLAATLDAGIGVSWLLIFMVTDGQLGLGLAVLGCLLAGSATAIVALAGPVPSPPAPEIRISGSPRRESRRAPAPQPAEPPSEAGEPKPDPSVYW